MSETIPLPFPLPVFTLAGRSTQAEVMDEPQVSANDYRRCLRDLAQVNRLTFTHRPILAWLDRVLPRDRPVRILDVAFGQGDLLRTIWQWAKSRGLEVSLEGIDLNPRSAAMARDATPPRMKISYLTGDVFAHAARADFIVSSQFTHHLDDALLLRFVHWLEASATMSWFITDLERSEFAYRAFPWLCALTGFHDLVERDGLVSIARSLRRDEWKDLLDRAHVNGQVRRHLPFRLSVEG
jgi:2-polyprenyl-3-methyl-5-hydroxy-6-metoxy-1,4-benzoquinol methylase